MKDQAKSLQSKGRYGDSMLVHMNPKEVEALSAMSPIGLTTNPDTGLQEAFLPLLLGGLLTGGLSSLFGGLGAGAALAAPAAASATGALGATALSEGLLAGLTSAGAGGIGTAASTAALGAAVNPAAQAATAGLSSAVNPAVAAGTDAFAAATNPALAAANPATQAATGATGINATAAQVGQQALTETAAQQAGGAATNAAQGAYGAAQPASEAAAAAQQAASNSAAPSGTFGSTVPNPSGKVPMNIPGAQGPGSAASRAASTVNGNLPFSKAAGLPPGTTANAVPAAQVPQAQGIPSTSPAAAPPQAPAPPPQVQNAAAQTPTGQAQAQAAQARQAHMARISPANSAPSSVQPQSQLQGGNPAGNRLTNSKLGPSNADYSTSPVENAIQRNTTPGPQGSKSITDRVTSQQSRLPNGQPTRGGLPQAVDPSQANATVPQRGALGNKFNNPTMRVNEVQSQGRMGPPGTYDAVRTPYSTSLQGPTNAAAPRPTPYQAPTQNVSTGRAASGFPQSPSLDPKTMTPPSATRSAVPQANQSQWAQPRGLSEAELNQYDSGSQGGFYGQSKSQITPGQTLSSRTPDIAYGEGVEAPRSSQLKSLNGSGSSEFQNVPQSISDPTDYAERAIPETDQFVDDSFSYPTEDETATATTADKKKGIFDILGDVSTAYGIASLGMAALNGLGGDYDDRPTNGQKKGRHIGARRTQNTPPDGYKPGVDDEFSFFNDIEHFDKATGDIVEYNSGGLVGKYDSELSYKYDSEAEEEDKMVKLMSEGGPVGGSPSYGVVGGNGGAPSYGPPQGPPAQGLPAGAQAAYQQLPAWLNSSSGLQGLADIAERGPATGSRGLGSTAEQNFGFDNRLVKPDDSSGGDSGPRDNYNGSYRYALDEGKMSYQELPRYAQLEHDRANGNFETTRRFDMDRKAGGGLIGMAKGGEVPSEGSSMPTEMSNTPKSEANQVIIIEAARALKGVHPEPETAIQDFTNQFGRSALEDLKRQVEHGKLDAVIGAIKNPEQDSGDGMSDSIPARTNKGQEVALSEGEFVVPADVVSSLGNGDTKSGSKALHEMMARIRSAKNGSAEQPRKIDPQQYTA